MGSLNSICSIHGCTNQAHSRTWCHKHYWRWWKHGSPHHAAPVPLAFAKRPAIERFREKTALSSTGCLLWTGAKKNTGYGTFILDATAGARTEVAAHRWIYEYANGAIPTGLVIDHLCRNVSCVNPDHMEPVTLATNVLRGFSPPALNAKKGYCKRGHYFGIENTHTTEEGWRVCRECKNLRRRVTNPRKAERDPKTGRFIPTNKTSDE